MFDKINEKYPLKEIVRFVVVGGINTVTFYVFFLLLHHTVGMYYLAAHILAFFISMVGSYFLNVFFTFGVRPSWKTFLQFPITQAVNVTVSSLLVYVFVEWLKIPSVVAPLFAVFFTVPITYIITAKILKRKEL
ncbi:MAG: GtrA family protein [Bacillus sp. (in: firmicutes)]